MNIFESPIYTVSLLILSCLLLCAACAYFWIKHKNTVQTGEKAPFSSISRIESVFSKLRGLRVTRNIIYISVSLENVRSLYSDAKAWSLFSAIKPVFAKYFSNEPESYIAVYDMKNFVVLNTAESEETERIIKACTEEIDRILLSYNAAKIVDVRFGKYSLVASSLLFNEALSRAKRACSMALDTNKAYAEWNSDGGKIFDRKIKMENTIENEINNNKFFLEYQPVLNAKTKKTVGAEVLSRLYSEHDGIITPNSFLQVLDSTGLNEKFDYYIFEKTCKWIFSDKAHREKYTYTINFSRSTLCDPTFADKILSIIKKYDLKASSLAIEILENKEVSGEAKSNMVSSLIKLRKYGINILLDDFGSGYTSYDDLQNLAIDILKIDKRITKNAHTEKGIAILKNIVKTASDLGIKTICEGIETAEEEKIAISAGCDMLQGYYYYHPMPVTKLEQLLQNESKKNKAAGDE